MELRIDRQAMVPVVQQIVDGLIEWIVQEQVPPATRLPSIRQIARLNLLSQSYVMEACERLVAQGVLASRQGAGFMVASTLPACCKSFDSPAFEGERHGCDTDPQWRGGLKLGDGVLPESWRESDDLAYAIRQVARTDMASLFNYNTPLGLPALREHIVKRLGMLDITADEDCVLTTPAPATGSI